MNNRSINGGATIWARQTIDSEVFYWRPDKWFKIWFFIVNKVNHKDTKLFKRGTNFMTYEEISRYTKATRDQIDGFMRFSKKNKMLTTQKTTRGMVVEVSKYDYFQRLSNYENDTENETKTKHKRNTNDTINKNDKNDKYNNISKTEVLQEKPKVNEIISFFKAVSPNTYQSWFENNTERRAVETLIKKFPAEKLETLIVQILPQLNVLQYVPANCKAFKPTELLRNIDRIIAKVKEIQLKRSPTSKTLTEIPK